jgi:hypothetical protein
MVCNFVLKYLYLDEVDAESSTSDLLDLLELAHFYGVPGLLSTCTDFLHNKISPETCVEIYERTVLFTELPLSSSAFHELTSYDSIQLNPMTESILQVMK